MTKQWCGIDHEHRCIVATEACGCLVGASVITHSEAEAYKFAAQQAKAGRVIREARTEEFRVMPMHCAEHPDGPPWWKRNRGRRKAATSELGL